MDCGKDSVGGMITAVERFVKLYSRDKCNGRYLALFSMKESYRASK
jgi:hypothetical protein